MDDDEDEGDDDDDDDDDDEDDGGEDDHADDGTVHGPKETRSNKRKRYLNDDTCEASDPEYWTWLHLDNGFFWHGSWKPGKNPREASAKGDNCQSSKSAEGWLQRNFLPSTVLQLNRYYAKNNKITYIKAWAA